MNFISTFSHSGITGKIIVAVYNLSKMDLNWENIENFDLTFEGDWTNMKAYGGDKNIFNQFINNIFDRNQNNHNRVLLHNECPDFGKINLLRNYFNCENIKLQQLITKKIKFNQDILNEVRKYKTKFNIDKDTLGIHFRLTSLNKYHGKDYGFIHYEDYINKIREIIKVNNISKLFIISDNNESIIKISNEETLKDLDIQFISEYTRMDTEVVNDGFIDFEIPNLFKKNFYEEVIIEALLLSMCGYLIHRQSSVSLLSCLLSNSLRLDTCYKLNSKS